MKNLILAFLTCLLIPVISLAHGGVYVGPGGIGTGSGFVPAGTGTTIPTGGPTGTATTGGSGGSTGAGTGGSSGGPSGGGAVRPAGGPVRPSGGAVFGGSSGGGRRKKASDPYMNWETWWGLNDDRFLLLKKKLRQEDASTENADIFLGDSSGLEVDIEKITRKKIINKIVPALKIALKDPYYDARAGAVIALGKVADPLDTDSLARISGLLGDPSKQVRESACLALGLLGNPDSVSILKDIVEANKNGRNAVGRHSDILNRTRSFACIALGLIRHQRNDVDVSKFLIDILRSDAPTDRKVAATIGIYLTQDKEVVPELIHVFESDNIDIYVKAHIATALGKLRDKASSITLMKHLRSKHSHISRSCAIALGLVANSKDLNLAKTLRKRLSVAPHRSIKNFSMLSLGEMGSDLGQSVLVDRLRKGQPMDKSYAALALGIQGFKGKLRDKVGVSQVVYGQYTKSKSPSMKGAFAISLGLLGATEYAEKLRADIGNISTQGVQGYLAISLALLNDRNSIPTIRELVKDRGDINRRKRAAIALGMLRDRKAVALLKEVMKDSKSSKAILGSATVAMGHIGDRTAIPTLVDMVTNIKDNQDVTRAFATVALGYLGDREDIPLLSKIHENSNYMAPTESLVEILTIL